jgi:hypothetical protein
MLISTPLPLYPTLEEMIPGRYRLGSPHFRKFRTCFLP